MRFLVTVAVLLCVVTTSLSRPAESNEPGDSVLEEAEYEGDEEPASKEDSLREEGDSNLDKQEPTYEQEDEEEAIQKSMNAEGKRGAPAPSDNQSPMDKSDTAPDYKLNADRDSEDMKPNDALQPNVQRHSNRYAEDKDADEQTEMLQNSANDDVNRKELVQANRRRSSKTTADDKGDELFENAVIKERTFKMSDRPANIDSAIESNHEGFFKHYYKSLLQGVDEKARLEDKNYENFPTNVYRNRRQAQNLGLLDNSQSLTPKDNSKNTIHGKEEMAIKRHIQKLSDQELEDLLNSLPEDKRVLLNKIIESDKSHSDNLSKRDITKKAGAVEENNDIDNGVFDSSKVQGGGSSVEIKNEAGTNIDTTDKTKQSDHTEISEESSPKKSNNFDLSCDKDASVNVDENKSGLHLNDVSINGESKSQTNAETNDQSSKINNKREADLNGLENEDSFISDATFINADFNPSDSNENTNEAFGYKDEDLSQLTSSEELLEDNNHSNKREALENTDSFKSLEESFPSSNTYKESAQYSEMDMVPLVRVKRKNEGSLIKKRSAELVPDAKVAYIPYRAENDDDSEEGNEFEDEGFYDRTFNYAKENEKSQSIIDMGAKNLHSKEEKTEHTDISRYENIESDTMNIGSDSDSVLSGVEGVDDNLMLRSGSRNRRTVENMSTGVEDARRFSLSDTGLKTQTDNLNVLNYQENDAFGPLPRNYEGDLNRLKRVRRLKTSSGDVSSSNTDT